jgi:hypothetical protein
MAVSTDNGRIREYDENGKLIISLRNREVLAGGNLIGNLRNKKKSLEKRCNLNILEIL